MRDLRFEAGGVVGSGVVAALFATTRMTFAGRERLRRLREEGRRVIFVFWHGHLLPLVHAHRGERIVVLVSEHGDGEYISRILRRNGFGTVRGSSTRGGIKGLKGLVRAARAGRDLGVSPDGPRGPAGHFKPGALAVARLTGLPIVPIVVGASRGWRLGSWDRFLVPRPFSTVRVEYLEPRFVPRDAHRSELEAVGAELEAAMNEVAAGLGAPVAPAAR